MLGYDPRAHVRDVLKLQSVEPLVLNEPIGQGYNAMYGIYAVTTNFKLVATLQAELDVDRSASLKFPAAQGTAEEVPPRQLQENNITIIYIINKQIDTVEC